jgi:HYR domain
MRSMRLIALALTSLAAAFALASPAAAAPPVNDSFDAATVVTALPFTEAINTAEATTAGDDPGSCFINNSVWYRYTPQRDVTVDINTAGSSYDAIVGVFTGVRGNLQSVGCDRRLLLNLQGGVSYYLMVNGCCYYGGQDGGDLRLSIQEAAPPPNDDWDTATAVSAVPFQLSESTLLATTAPDDGFFYGKKTVWFSFTPSETRRVAISTIGSDYQTDVAVYRGTRDARDYATCDYPRPGVQWCDLQAGVAYHIVVSAAYGFGGTLVFSVLELPTASLTIDDHAFMGLPNSPSTVRISGTAFCSQPTTMQFEAWFLQGLYSSAATGHFACSPAGTPWTVDVPDYGYFTPGEGTATISASGVNVAGYVYAQAATTALLSRYTADETPPALSIPDGVLADATSPAGAVVGYDVSATDAVDASPTVACVPPSGSRFPIGVTTVTCTAIDDAGNAANASFTVAVLGASGQLARLVRNLNQASNLPVAVKAQLLAKLQPLVAALDPSKPAEQKAVCNALALFITVAQRFSGTAIPPAQAAEWVTDASRIGAVLVC